MLTLGGSWRWPGNLASKTTWTFLGRSRRRRVGSGVGHIQANRGPGQSCRHRHGGSTHRFVIAWAVWSGATGAPAVARSGPPTSINQHLARPARPGNSAAPDRLRGFRAKRVPVSGFGHAGRGGARDPVRVRPAWAHAQAHAGRGGVRGGPPGGPVQAFLSIAVSRPTPACSRLVPLRFTSG